MYPPPSSVKYSIPKPIFNGMSRNSKKKNNKINCGQVTDSFKWLLCHSFFRIKFWKTVLLIILVVTVGQFLLAIIFRRIRGPAFSVKLNYHNLAEIDSNGFYQNSKKEPSGIVYSHRRMLDNLMSSANRFDDKRTVIGKKLRRLSARQSSKNASILPAIHKEIYTSEGKTLLPLSTLTEKSFKPQQRGMREKLVGPDVSDLNSESGLKLCPPVPSNLEGPLKVELSNVPSLEEQESMHPELDPGGRFHLKECQTRHKVAIIIPFRDRKAHLAVFLHNMHTFLQKQQIDYAIYVIEQAGGEKFNRAMLMNVGAIEALKLYPYDCFIFHDVDLIPEDDRNLYTCPVQPRHMSVAISTLKYKLPYKDIFGGVSAMTVNQFKTVNGFSNKYWGWGGEDDDMSNRLRFHGFYISRYPVNIARYIMMSHEKNKANPRRYLLLNVGKRRYNADGLSTVRYKILDMQLRKLYTWFYVELQQT